jgi:peptidoglycan/xylan/chitin deacetylase (PgdA/CDA1 family)
MNRHALRMTQRLGFRCASDCRGDRPFIPVWDGEVVHCPQLPTTLPTLDELIGRDGLTENTVAEAILARTEKAKHAQVFTMHAELEGMKLAPVLERLLQGWRAQGYQLVDLGTALASLDPAKLPRCRLEFGSTPGRSGTLVVQSEEFLAGAPPALAGAAAANRLLGS